MRMASIYHIITKLSKFQFVIKVCLKYFWNFLFKLSLSDDSLQPKLLKCEKSRLKSVEVSRKKQFATFIVLFVERKWTNSGYDLQNFSSQFITTRLARRQSELLGMQKHQSRE